MNHDDPRFLELFRAFNLLRETRDRYRRRTMTAEECLDHMLAIIDKTEERLALLAPDRDS